jgi:hypothetical protein
MKNRKKIIIITYLASIIVSLIYSVYILFTGPESSTLGVPFAFILLSDLSLFVVSIFFMILYVKYFYEIWQIVVPTFIITSLIPIYFIISWHNNKPLKIEKSSVLPVSSQQYSNDSNLIINDYKTKEIDSNGFDKYRSKIYSVIIDTIIYSKDYNKFFSIIITNALDDENKLVYCSEYRVGKKENKNWLLGNPRGNIWSTCFDSISNLKYELRQYYYKKFSINGSSKNKPEIWEDDYIFYFE